jgi:LPS-assembly lipoprotein
LNLSNINATLCTLSFVVILATLTSCGFELRGVANIAFESIYIQGNTLTISKNLVKSLKVNDIKVSNSAENADLQLELMGEESEKRILSLSGDGLVREFELFYRIHYRTRQTDAALWSPVQTIEARRDFSYSDANILAKQAEERQLNENMQTDVLSNLMRRLSRLKK